MKQWILVATMALMTAPAQAMDFTMMDFSGIFMSGNKGHKTPKVCKKINFSADQKIAYQQVRKMFMQETKPVRTRLKRTFKRYRQVLKDTSIPGKRADRIAARMRKLMGRMGAATSDMFHTIVYDVATVDQRKPLLRCVRQMKRQMMMKKLKKMQKGPKKTGNQKPA